MQMLRPSPKQGALNTGNAETNKIKARPLARTHALLWRSEHIQ